jgi:hypothetical protein
VSRGALCTARVLSVLFLTFDAVIKVLRLEIVAQSAVELGRTRLRACTASRRTSRHLRVAPGLLEGGGE